MTIRSRTKVTSSLRVLAWAALVSVGLWSQSMAQWREERRPPPTPPTPGLWGKSTLGGQVGPWYVAKFGTDVNEQGLSLRGNNAALHLEFFYQPHLAGVFNLDLSLGAINRGDLSLSDASGALLGRATLYPIGLGIIAFPAAKKTEWRLQPLLRLGGSLLVGTQQAEGQDYFGNVFVGSTSRTALGYYGGGGLQCLLSPSLALTGCVKYQYAKFNRELFGARDYSGVQVLIGAAYLYR